MIKVVGIIGVPKCDECSEYFVPKDDPHEFLGDRPRCPICGGEAPVIWMHRVEATHEK